MNDNRYELYFTGAEIELLKEGLCKVNDAYITRERLIAWNEAMRKLIGCKY